MNHKPTLIGETLHNLLQDIGVEKKIKQYDLLAYWPELVGENIAQITNALRVRDDILYIKVKSMTWRTELLFQKPHILTKIAEKYGNGLITDIRFQ